MKNFLVIFLVVIFYVLVVSLQLESFLSRYDLLKIESEYLEEIIKNVALIVLAVIVIVKLKLTELGGLSKKLSWNSWYLALIPFYLIIIAVTQVKDLDFSLTSSFSLILLLLSTLSIGFSEEFVFRGVLQSLFLKELVKKKGKKSLVFASVLIPAIIFGLLHLLNFRVDNTASEVSQLIYAIFIGTAFGAILLRTNKLIPLAIIHGLIDFVFNLDELSSQTQNLETSKSIISAIATVIVVAPMFIVGLLIIRKIEVSDITNKATV